MEKKWGPEVQGFFSSVCMYGEKGNIFVYMYHTEWRRPIGCLTKQVIFRKRATNHRVLLRKTTYKDKTSYDSVPPGMYICK